MELRRGIIAQSFGLRLLSPREEQYGESKSSSQSSGSVSQLEKRERERG